MPHVTTKKIMKTLSRFKKREQMALDTAFQGFLAQRYAVTGQPVETLTGLIPLHWLFELHQKFHQEKATASHA